MASGDMTHDPVARVGMIVPSGNILAEAQVLDMLPPAVGLHVTRLRLTGSSDADLDGMLDDLPRSADLLADTRADLIAFNCTAVSTRRPGADEAIAETIRSRTSIATITTGTALVAGLRALQARRVVLVTPYIAPVVESEAAFLGWHGFEVLAAHGAGISSNWDMAQEPAQRWIDLALSARDQRADAYVLSCTAIRTHDSIGLLEAALGQPVLTSNQSLVWHMLNQLSVAARQVGYGRLMTH